MRDAKGRSVAHLRLNVVGPAFCAALRGLRGKTLGCWCDPEGPCHAKILAELAETLPEPPAEAPPEHPNEAWTITWGDSAMNEVHMQRIGQEVEKGLSVERLRGIKDELEAKGMLCDLIDLRQLLPVPER